MTENEQLRHIITRLQCENFRLRQAIRELSTAYDYSKDAGQFEIAAALRDKREGKS